MKLLSSESEFIESRKRLAFFWKIFGPVILVVYICLVGLLIWKAPLLINPFSVMSGIENGNIPPAMLSLMAGILPMVVIAMLVAMGSLIAFSFCSFSRERAYIQIIESQEVRETQKIL